MFKTFVKAFSESFNKGLDEETKEILRGEGERVEEFKASCKKAKEQFAALKKAIKDDFQM